ncbi:MAG: RsmE family RNA methyltransferase [Candidatus Omnitrophota bacterium]
MHRFYYPSLTQDQNKIKMLSKEEIHHLVDVLRLKKESQVTIFNGQGLEALGVISSSSKREIEIETLSFLTQEKTYPLLTLACAIPKKAKFETIIEKCTELGVDEIIPLKTARTEMTGSIESLQRKTKRFLEVAVNACKQSQRSFLPEIHPIMTFEEMLTTITSNDISLIGSLRENKKRFTDISMDQLKKASKIYLFIGPEGDFTDEEISLALDKECLPISLGPQVLKVETAAICAISYLMLSLRS